MTAAAYQYTCTPHSDAMTSPAPYPIGTPGNPWDDAEFAEWRSRQTRQSSYAMNVLRVVERLRSRFDVAPYGLREYPPDSYPLLAICQRNWDDNLPRALITGGVHGRQ